ncbi:MAG: Ig-like domain-containing protein [Chloroflexi bacterium]|nr:Ig-like domain-containing protein [Chloroflexota bacterium]
MRKQGDKARTILALALMIFGGVACNLLRPTAMETPAATPAIPQVKILFPAHNQQVIEGVVFDIEIHASDQAVGIQRVELYVDEVLQQTSASESGSVRDYRVTMNWYAKELGWHKFAVIAYRADGGASHPHIIALEVIAPA